MSKKKKANNSEICTYSGEEDKLLKFRYNLNSISPVARVEEDEEDDYLYRRRAGQNIQNTPSRTGAKGKFAMESVMCAR